MIHSNSSLTELLGDLSEINRGKGGGKQGRVPPLFSPSKGRVMKKWQEKSEGHKKLSQHM